MFEREHHQKVLSILKKMNPEFLLDTKCYFGGGTAISLLYGEFRESIDIDFLCADQDGYRKLRNSVFNNGLGDIFSQPIELMRDVRADRDGIRAVISADGTPIKFEIVREARIELSGMMVASLPVPCLTSTDLFAEKLLANADRYADKSVMSRDIIDLMMMEKKCTCIPKQAWDKAREAYGDSVRGAFDKSKQLLRSNPEYFRSCLAKMGMSDELGLSLEAALNSSLEQPD
ncbi:MULTISPECIES: nucleotidyl transferase AbiEii/AbiGii toxin family protein [unclassified Undibacterium]|uniref:nucleotidyl transferase AbiEii/AbiGii toxin family protein n=1 Tax=unclassified Undibacterium TaxID=2630295 RepID=UPI002AC9D9A9|nr:MULTISPECIES: nucleotidyl transferase AbiEii/AbiGii toxin family protein [unclassified Undibacterium]MEB0138668.1 nucleotidyl transferase AbiEii/AbiGii toxin family protein [Undibacterium sp. CCC2.1]MEB0171469.1 nucleotidyl transferase AbiEii/AbiGii toxin family protein [Undibacterium sp. CCC1.1]MEB0175799.1 nucleotidyl transferase AbiEii/AbiGii toxin family protein [Undibacterium sp. CCC3.4]MEB0214372.1 nucleotidyl transferase AbiEii/AbiGii toxin family protein [Undibacterium sp. 5I2]WPX44